MEQTPHSDTSGPIDRIIEPRTLKFGGLVVRRLLPSKGFHNVGPWVFFDHFGPSEFGPGSGVDVIPHPHINLSTVTYLFEGEMVHRDSIGSVQAIRPGAVNLMCAGRGIAHSERTGRELRASGHALHGIQLWCGLPEVREEEGPTFDHYPADALPSIVVGKAQVRVMIGNAFGVSSPVKVPSPTLYAEAVLGPESALGLPPGIEQLALYTVSGRVSIDDTGVEPHRLTVIAAGRNPVVTAPDTARIALIGGAPVGKRYMWWNFVSSRMDRIQRAKNDWDSDRFGRIPGETEREPLPERDAFFDGDASTAAQSE